MNIIVPKSPKIDHMVLDFRDALEGEEMTFNPGDTNDLSNWVVVVPKRFMKDSDGKFTFEHYVHMKQHFSDISDDNHLKNLQKSFHKGCKVITIPNGKKSITVSAPLWKYSEQLITILVKNPITELGETRQFLDITDGGMLSLDSTYHPEDYVRGNGVAEHQQNSYIRQKKGVERSQKNSYNYEKNETEMGM